MYAPTPLPSMVMALEMVTFPYSPASNALTMPSLLVWSWANWNVAQGLAIGPQAGRSAPERDTQVLSFRARAGMAASTVKAKIDVHFMESPCDLNLGAL